MISKSNHVFVFEMGRHSRMLTTSPSAQALDSSCACNLVDRVMYFLYFGCIAFRSIFTVIVLFLLALTTSPVNVFIWLLILYRLSCLLPSRFLLVQFFF